MVSEQDRSLEADLSRSTHHVDRRIGHPVERRAIGDE